MGQKKSSEPVWLIRHLLIQCFIFTVGLAPFLGLWAIIFATINALIHGVIDWYIWKGYKLCVYKKICNNIKNEGWDYEPKNHPTFTVKCKEWKYWEDHMFYSTIGLDQLLHILTIITLFSFL